VVYKSDAGNNIWLILKKRDTRLINYNFQLNITLTGRLWTEYKKENPFITMADLITTVLLFV